MLRTLHRRRTQGGRGAENPSQETESRGYREEDVLRTSHRRNRS